MARLPGGREPRTPAARPVSAADARREVLRLAEIGLGRPHARLTRLGRATADGSLASMIAGMDAHLGRPDDVIASLQTDSTLARSTDLAVQVPSIDPPPPFILRSIALVAEVVAPALGWGRDAAQVGHVRVTTEPRGR